MAQFCLTKEAIDNFKQGLISREINPEKLSDMSTDERRSFLAKYVGESNAKDVNALFESKLLLKNQKAGYIAFAKKVSGLSPEAKRDFVSKVNSLEKALNPEEEKQFLGDLVEKRLGVAIKPEEAKKISELAKNAQSAKENITDEKSRIAYGNALLDLQDYADSISKTKMNIGNNIINTLNIPRSILSSFDLSAPLRQGFGMVGNPKEFLGAFKDMFKYFASEKAYRDSLADITTRPTYELMKDAGLRITKLDEKLSQREEAFISSFTDKLPIMRGSERAYTGFLNKLRADVFDKMVKSAENNGESIVKGSPVLKDLASVVNDFTGSGNIGKNDQFKGAVPLLNSLFFAPRKIAATINIFNPLTYAKLSPTARMYAIRNLVSMVGVSALVLSLAKMNGAKVETDPKSSDFGKIALGNTRLDVTGGNANYLVLLARLFSGKTKNSVSEITKDLNGQIGSSSRGDILIKYIRNKLSPTASFIADWLYGQDAVGNPFNVSDEVKNRAIPLIIQDTIDSAKNDPTHTVLSSILDMFGVGTQTYTNTTNWNQTPTKAESAFLQSIGKEKFNQANEEYNQEYNDWLNKTQKTPAFSNLSEQGKQNLLTKEKRVLQKKIFERYNFEYKPDRTATKNEADQIGQLVSQ